MQWEWVQWLIPLVALAVWILSTMARVREEEQPRRARPPQARSDAPEAQPRKSDVNQFLDEARRRREQRDARKKAEEESRRPPPVREEVRRTPPPVSPTRAKPERKPSPPPLPKVVVKPAPQSRSTAQKAEEVVVAKIVTPPALPDAPPQVTQFETVQQPARPRVFDMLRNRDNLQAAFVLREVFDAPLCKREKRKS